MLDLNENIDQRQNTEKSHFVAKLNPDEYVSSLCPTLGVPFGNRN